MMNNNKQQGFTLIEMMIALALGLVISAAAVMLFLTGQRGHALQQGMSNVQENGNFGLNYITRDIRASNLNNSTALINNEVKYSGIVFTSSANGVSKTEGGVSVIYSNLPNTIVGATANAALLSRSGGLTNVEGSSPGVVSDQLVIQYVPQYKLDDKGTTGTATSDADDTIFGGFDCEGNRIEFLAKKDAANPTRPYGRHMVVQRYFLRQDTNNSDNEPNAPLGLACEAGTYSLEEEPTTIRTYTPTGDVLKTFGGDGQIIMKRVDHLRVLYGYIGADDKFRYVSAADYMGLTGSPKPRIVSVQLGLLTRSTQSVGSDATFDNDKTYQILDQLVKVKTPAANTPNYVRQVITQTVALRNSFGDRGQ